MAVLFALSVVTSATLILPAPGIAITAADLGTHPRGPDACHFVQPPGPWSADSPIAEGAARDRHLGGRVASDARHMTEEPRQVRRLDRG